MLSPYAGSDSKGMLLLDSEMLIEIGQKAMPAGISLAVHAIGDRANREVLNGYAQLQKDGFALHSFLEAKDRTRPIDQPGGYSQTCAIGYNSSHAAHSCGFRP